MITIEDIISNKITEIEKDKEEESIEELLQKIKYQEPTRDFYGALKKPGVNIIAEIKIKSPSMDKKDLDPLEIAQQYNESNVAAISVLTDNKYFGGDKKIMQEVRRKTDKPILRKDFILNEYQVYQSRAYGADAILLISHLSTICVIKDYLLFDKISSDEEDLNMGHLEQII